MNLRIFWKSDTEREAILMALSDATTSEELYQAIDRDQDLRLSPKNVLSPPDGLVELASFPEGHRWILQTLAGSHDPSLFNFTKAAVSKAQDSSSIRDGIQDIISVGLDNLAKYGYAFAEQWYVEKWGTGGCIVFQDIAAEHLTLTVTGTDMPGWIPVLKEHLGINFKVEEVPA